MSEASAWPARFFKPQELACRCCGEVHVDPEALMRLDRLRMLLDKPVFVTSGYRCPAHNAAVGGAKNSLHLKGKAFDLPYGGAFGLQELLTRAQHAGFTGFGFYTRFLHVDTGPARCWVGA